MAPKSRDTSRPSNDDHPWRRRAVMSLGAVLVVLGTMMSCQSYDNNNTKYNFAVFLGGLGAALILVPAFLSGKRKPKNGNNSGRA